MKYLATKQFWDCYHKLPIEIQELADKYYDLLKQNQNHPSLNLKQIGRYYSVKIGRKYRALGIETDGNIVWFWIGSHEDYNHLI